MWPNRSNFTGTHTIEYGSIWSVTKLKCHGWLLNICDLGSIIKGLIFKFYIFLIRKI